MVRMLRAMVALQRRTQEERRATTRAALLSAALDALVEHGLAGFTTPDVCRRAGVSQGGLFKHFASKSELLSATAEHLFDRLRADYEAAYLALPPRRRTARHGLQLLWKQMLDVRLAAAYELYTAARTDPELRAALEPVVRAHVDRIAALSASLAGDADPRRVRDAVDLAILSMQGLVLNQMALPDAAALGRLARVLDRLTPALLEP
jgi:AcrR family transcriptional regulator